VQTAARVWTRDARGGALRPMRLRGGAGTFGGTTPRCQRCDIPLGSGPCPNPLCPEQHGQSAGALCAWCWHHQETCLTMMDIQ